MNKKIEPNLNLFTSVKLAREALSSETSAAVTTEEKRCFVVEPNCIEVLDPVDLKGEFTNLLETILNVVPLYGPEGVMFVKTDKPHTLAMQMHVFINSWDHLNIKELKEKQERKREREPCQAVNPHPLKLNLKVNLEYQQT